MPSAGRDAEPPERPGPGWLKLDLHNHSHRSYDARLTAADYERAHAAGLLDVVAITDHNRIDGALELRASATFPVIVGQEIDTAEGELIGLFLEQAIPADLPIAETARRIRDQGGLVYLQHPFYRLVRRPLTTAVRERLAGAELIDIVEVLNGGPLTARANRRAELWARQHGLPQAASSDAHDPPDLGTCVTLVPPGPLDTSSLLERLRQGVPVDRRRRSAAILATKARSRTAKAAGELLRVRRLSRRRP